MELEYDIEELEAKFKYWETTLAKIVDASIDNALKVFDDCEIPITRMTIPNKAYPSRFFRARIISSNSCEDLSDPKTYSYPPIANTKSYQRANVPGCPVFYGALDAHTALEEIKKNGVDPLEKDDIIFLSEWRLKEDTDITLNYLTLPEIIEENQLYSILTRKVYKELEELFSEKGAKYVNFQLALFARISRLFLSENYIQSSIIAYNIMFLTPKINGLKIDGIIYPSCSNQFRSVNVALNPEFVDNNLELVGVSKLKFNQFSRLGAEVSNTYVGTFDGDKILWTSQVSELLTDEYDTIFISELQWDEAKTTAAHFYFNSEITDLDAFCKKELKSIDKFKEIKSKDGIPIDLSKKLACIFELNVDSTSTFLKSGNEVNPIYMLQLVIPLKSFTQEIPHTEVLKG